MKSCCVPFCRSRKTKDSKLSFHSFPVSKNLREQWLQAVQQYTRKSPRNFNPFVIKDYTKVCSTHFLKTDYWYAGNVLKLRKNAVPTVFILPKEKGNVVVVSSTSKEEKEKKQDILKEDQLALNDRAVKNNTKNVTVKIRPKKLIDSEKSKGKSVKGIKNLENPEMIQNCRNLLLINKDHSYALWQNESVKGKRDNSSEDDTDNDETEIGMATDATDNTNTNLHTQQKSPATVEAVVEETESIILNQNNIEPQDKTDLVNTDVNKTIESVFLKEEVVEEFSENVEETHNDKSNKVVQDAITENDNISCNQPADNQNISTVATNIKHRNIGIDNVLHTKPSKRVNAISKKNLPEICILCATANMSRKNYTLIVHFAKMIVDLSGVDILKSNVAPIACNVCFKNVLEMWNFKQQIIAADKFIREKIPKQPSTHSNSGNVPKPTATTFDYINCNKRNVNNTRIDIKSHTKPENVIDLDQEAPIQKNSKPLSTVKDKSKNDLQKKDNGVTLVPIENILKENSVTVDVNDDDIDSESSEGCSDLPTCTSCGNAFTNSNINTCKCKKSVKKKDVQSEKFVCSICGKQYPLLRSLKRHEITHNTKKYLCSICGEVFHFKLYLKRHMRKHSGKKPFACLYCNKRFSSQWNLSQHKRLHTNSLPYECRLCPTAFRHNVTLKKHVRLFHTADEFMRNCQSSTSSVNPDDAKN